MKLRTMVKIAVSSSVILLCAGLALYFFFRLSAAKQNKDINFFELVPPTATTVFTTDDMTQFVSEIDELNCSKDRHYLHVSKLFSCLKQVYYRFSEDSPHGLSRQMNRLCISFHQPNHELNQVLYCPLGAGDRELIDQFAEKYFPASYSPRKVEYRGEKIVIYPMKDGGFLASYLTPDYMVWSFQKKLIEEVIDASKDKKALAQEAAFKALEPSPDNLSLATVYAKLRGMMGWSEFDMDMKDDCIYFTGHCHDTDSCSFVNVLRRQESVEGVPGEALPASTFYFSRQKLTDWNAFLSCGLLGTGGTSGDADEQWTQERDLYHYLMEYTDGDALVGLFQRTDTTERRTAAVLSLSLPDEKMAEKHIWPLVHAASHVNGMRKSRVSFCRTSHRTYPVYRLPQTALFSQLTGVIEPAAPIYAAFYQGRLLLSSGESDVYDYIRQLEAGKVFNGTVAHQTGVASLTDDYRFMLMADFGYLLGEMENQVQYFPDFFWQNADFFRHFILFAQFTCVDDIICSHLVLKYQPDQP